MSIYEFQTNVSFVHLRHINILEIESWEAIAWCRITDRYKSQIENINKFGHHFWSSDSKRWLNWNKSRIWQKIELMHLKISRLTWYLIWVKKHWINWIKKTFFPNQISIYSFYSFGMKKNWFTFIYFNFTLNIKKNVWVQISNSHIKWDAQVTRDNITWKTAGNNNTTEQLNHSREKKARTSMTLHESSEKWQ